MTKAELQKQLDTAKLLISAILDSVTLANNGASRAKFNASMKNLNKRIKDYKKIQ